ncbi:MAG: LamG domain-containing protein [Sedimentisphaerales bacterium]|nr:LamG domain-containing protein [Sedimentisphaerales bacterium]
MMKYERKYNRGTRCDSVAPRREGIALIIILVLITAIVVVGLGFIIRGDTELVCGQNMELKADMDYLAESGLEHARGLILNPQDVSEDYWPGDTEQQLNPDSNDYYDVTVDVCEPNWLNWQITSSAYRQAGGSSVAESSLTANLRLDPAVAFWSATPVLLDPCMSITGDVYCNGVINNKGSINGDCFADSLTGNAATGAVKSKSTLDINRPAITSSLLTSNFSTQTISGSSLSSTTLSSSYQVFYKSGDLEIKKNVIIKGCLAVDGNLTISDTNNTSTAKKNAPAIYVSGNLIVKERAAITITGLVFVNGLIELPICCNTPASITRVTGSLFTNGGIRYRNIVPDYSGSGNDGVINGDCNRVVGKVNSAIKFDGDGDFINIGPNSLNITNLITVAAWIKVSAFDKTSQAIVTKGDTSWRLQRSANTNFMEFDCNGVGSVVGSINVNDGQWHHIAGVYSSNPPIKLYLYVDGQKDKDGSFPGSGSISSNLASIYIGGNSEVSGRWFNGIIDEVRVYNVALSLAQISAIFGGSAPTTNLVGYWSMDWGTTTVNAAPTKAAIYHWPGGSKDRWSPAAGAFYKSIKRIEN